jgi:Insertion element 4 transposase N-terminal
MITVPRPVTVAAGVLAPGHLGELTGYVPFELVDDVLEETLSVQRRTRLPPSRVGVYFVLAITMFPGWHSDQVADGDRVVVYLVGRVERHAAEPDHDPFHAAGPSRRAWHAVSALGV